VAPLTPTTSSLWFSSPTGMSDCLTVPLASPTLAITSLCWTTWHRLCLPVWIWMMVPSRELELLVYRELTLFKSTRFPDNELGRLIPS
jgi:hypothetical protein